MTKRTIESAPRAKVELFRDEMSATLWHIAAMMKEPEQTEEQWLKYCYVTDESRVADFFRQEAEIVELQQRLGLDSLDRLDFLCDLAATLRRRNRGGER